MALDNYPVLHDHRIVLEIGRVKNRSNNPVAGRAVQELELELLRQDPQGGLVSPVVASVANATLKSRIWSGGLSTREMWTQTPRFFHVTMMSSPSNTTSVKSTIPAVSIPSPSVSLLWPKQISWERSLPMVLGARLQSSLAHSYGVPPFELGKLSSTKSLWTLHLPCHITWAVRGSTPITTMIPYCLQLRHHRNLQLLPHPHLNCTRPQMLYLHAARHCCSFYTSFSSRLRH